MSTSPTPVMDRLLQREILELLQPLYPNHTEPESIGFTESDRAWVMNISYLEEHGLVDVHATSPLSGERIVMDARITHRGLDFLADDGGLTAVLGVLTVRFEAETLKALLAAKVDASALPAEQKSAIKKKLQELGSDALKETTKRLLDAALDQGPAMLQLLQTLLG